jgi:hypothetical protein
VNAQFVSLAVGYALGGGQLRRKGARRNPWLELRRLETESTYLLHQVRLLQRSGSGSVRADIDMLPGQGYYDLRRARLHSPLLERAMELLQVDEGQRFSIEALQVAGVRGIASLWLDAGRWQLGRGLLPVPSLDDAAVLLEYLLSHHGITATVSERPGPALVLAPRPMQDLAALLRPQVHRSMRHALHPGACFGRQLLENPKRQLA